MLLKTGGRRTFSADDLRVSNTGTAFISTEDLSLQLNETVLRGLLDQKKALSQAHVIGKVRNERDEAGRAKIEVISLEQHPW